MAWTKAGRNTLQTITTQDAAQWPWGINPIKLVSFSMTATNATNSSTIESGGDVISDNNRALSNGDSEVRIFGKPGVWYSPITVSAVVAQVIQLIYE